MRFGIDLGLAGSAGTVQLASAPDKSHAGSRRGKGAGAARRPACGKAQPAVLIRWPARYVRHVVDTFGPDRQVVARTITNEINVQASPNTSDGPIRGSNRRWWPGSKPRRPVTQTHESFKPSILLAIALIDPRILHSQPAQNSPAKVPPAGCAQPIHAAALRVHLRLSLLAQRRCRPVRPSGRARRQAVRSRAGVRRPRLLPWHDLSAQESARQRLQAAGAGGAGLLAHVQHHRRSLVQPPGHDLRRTRHASGRDLLLRRTTR